MVLLAIGLYLLISVLVVRGCIGYARRNGKSVMRWGCGAILAMYLIPFWDLLPTVIANQYNCASNAGFFVYKTIDQWKVQNPGVLETLSITHLPEENRIKLDINDYSGDGRNRKYRLPDGTTLLAYFNVKNELMWVEYTKPDGESGYQINERFRYIYKTQEPSLIKLSREEYVVKDIATDEIMARQVNFHKKTKGKIWSGGEGWWKLWFQTDEGCARDKFPDGGIHSYIDYLRTDCWPERDTARFGKGVIASCH